MSTKKIEPPKTKHPIITTLLILIGLFILSSIFATITTVGSVFEEEEGEGNVALISVKGVITGDESGGLIDQTTTASSSIVKLIKEAEEDPGIKAIVLEINSPGGSPVASDEIATAIKNTDKPTVAWIREIGTSGAYWIATATDHIIAHKLSLTGSIGVRASYLEFSGFLKRYNVTYQRLVAGKYKDTGSPFKQLTPEEETLLQAKINKIHEAFIKEVAQNRNLPEDTVRELANGMFYLGEEALTYGLIDEVGGREEVTEYLEKTLNTSITYKEFKEKKSLAELLAGIVSNHGYAVGQGIMNTMITTQQVITT